MSRALVVGGSPNPISINRLRELVEITEFVVAVDKGMDICLEANISPDLFCGDGDSLSHKSAEYLEQHTSIERVVYNPHKDDTDLSLALDEVKRRGCDSVVVTSLLGGRIDHQLAVVGVLKSQNKLDVWWAEDDMIGRMLAASDSSSIRLNSACVGKTLSCIALEDTTIVSESGTRWEADHLELDALSDRGVSNVVESHNACIEVHQGRALICLNDAPLSVISE